ncbi:MAG TPA: NAD(P)H-dependent oxidoreductase [Methanoregulaceae archaeon]|nr:NAD(P)H-dependent oxidoreductase [Methanoregulaceae archaeon]
MTLLIARIKTPCTMLVPGERTVEFKDIVMQRYATKKFDGRNVPREKIDELIEYIRYAPSALNLQPWKIKIVTDKATKERLKPAAFDQEQVTTCSHLLVFCANPDYESLIEKLSRLLEKYSVPADIRKMVIDMANQFTGPMSPEQRFAWSQAQTYLALGNALNGAKALGLDSCPMGGFDPEAFSQILGIEKPLVPVMLCPVGYAADKPMPKIRFAKEEIVF